MNKVVGRNGEDKGGRMYLGGTEGDRIHLVMSSLGTFGDAYGCILTYEL